eukprot:1947158-Lingulodinium_polyedra.AAC.1
MAQTYQGLAVERVWLLHCDATDCWESAQGCWKSCFVPAGTVLLGKQSQECVVCLGDAQECVVCL